jgi:hypothetical protein
MIDEQLTKYDRRVLRLEQLYNGISKVMEFLEAKVINEYE